MLTGDYRNTLDEKGRIMFPSKLRSDLPQSSLILTQGLDTCLWLFTAKEWELLSNKIMENASPFQAQSRLVWRRLIAPAQEIEIDKTGRISIPQSLREYAGLKHDCVILGINRYIELWDVEIYNKYLADTEEQFQSATQELGNIFF